MIIPGQAGVGHIPHMEAFDARISSGLDLLNK